VKFAEPRPFSDPEAAVRKLVEIANAAEAARTAASILSGSMAPFSPPAAVRPNTAPASSARSRRAGCGDTNPGPTSNSPTPAPSCSPDEMPDLMPAKGWRRHFEEPIPLPDEMAAKHASWLNMLEIEIDAWSANASIGSSRRHRPKRCGDQSQTWTRRNCQPYPSQ
jgi:hypothetical protein